MHAGKIVLLLAGFATSFAVAACAKPLGPETCGDRACPAGTYHDNYSANRTGFDLSATADVKTYSGGVAFKNMGEGECRFTCVLMQPCPEGSVPVMTETCATCAVVVDGELQQAACQQ